MNRDRLLNVARALRESPNPGEFTMTAYFSCGTPACAFGHYAYRSDLQSLCAIKDGFILSLGGDRDFIDYDSGETCEHFGIDASEANELFGPRGCGNAQTAIEAAEYIERFVALHGES